MGLPDIACAVYRASQRPYRALFESMWGQQAFAMAWPSDVEQVCTRPGPPPAGDPMPVHLSSVDRGLAHTTFDQMAQSIAGYEAAAEVPPFTSKFDAVLAGKAQFTTQEQAGYDLFRGKAQCNACHRDGGHRQSASWPPGADPAAISPSAYAWKLTGDIEAPPLCPRGTDFAKNPYHPQ